MKNQGRRTFFLPATRADRSELERLCRLVDNNILIQTLLEVTSDRVMVLNMHRQIIAVNDRFLMDSGLKSVADAIGRRPGEVLECIHVPNCPGGCGTTKQCQTCDLVNSILNSRQTNQRDKRDCLITLKQKNGVGETAEFTVHAVATTIQKQMVWIVVCHDIREEKRRLAMEQTFLHDHLNAIEALLGWSDILKSSRDSTNTQAIERISALSKRLYDEVLGQNILAQMTDGRINVFPQNVRVQDVLENQKVFFSGHKIARRKAIDVAQTADSELLHVDVLLLNRVLTNMVKNALEATPNGQSIRIWFERQQGTAVFCVWNPSPMTETAKKQVFQRSFSTKQQAGRGLGTYSMKLIGERYLGGHVSFSSTPESGTTFRLTLPDRSIDPIIERNPHEHCKAMLEAVSRIPRNGSILSQSAAKERISKLGRAGSKRKTCF